MKFFAIGDVHFSFQGPVDPARWEDVETSKPMDVFGAEWRCHYRKMYENWLATVGPEDVVLMPGDFSWAMNLEQARYDLAFLGLLGTIAGVAGNQLLVAEFVPGQGSPARQYAGDSKRSSGFRADGSLWFPRLELSRRGFFPGS